MMQEILSEIKTQRLKVLHKQKAVCSLCLLFGLVVAAMGVMNKEGID